MLRRRRPFRHQEDIAASSVAANRPVSAAVSFPQIEPPPSNPFAIFPNEVTQHIFQFFNNSELPVTVNRQFLFNANEVKKMRAHYFFKRYLENQLDLDMATTGKILSTLKTICDYSKFCITSGMSPAEKQARQAVLLLMTMQIMEHSTRNDIVRYLLPRGVMQPIILPDGDGDFNVIEEHTPISSQEVADYKCFAAQGQHTGVTGARRSLSSCIILRRFAFTPTTDVSRLPGNRLSGFQFFSDVLRASQSFSQTAKRGGRAHADRDPQPHGPDQPQDRHERSRAHTFGVMSAGVLPDRRHFFYSKNQSDLSASIGSSRDARYAG